VNVAAEGFVEETESLAARVVGRQSAEHIAEVRRQVEGQPRFTLRLQPAQFVEQVGQFLPLALPRSSAGAGA